MVGWGFLFCFCFLLGFFFFGGGGGVAVVVAVLLLFVLVYAYFNCIHVVFKQSYNQFSVAEVSRKLQQMTIKLKNRFFEITCSCVNPSLCQ